MLSRKAAACGWRTCRHNGGSNSPLERTGYARRSLPPFDLITGNVRRDAGTVRFEERDVTGRSPWQVARLGIGRTFQLPRLFAEMTVLENLTAAVRGGSLRDAVRRALDLLEFVGLTGLVRSRTPSPIASPRSRRRGRRCSSSTTTCRSSWVSPRPSW